MKAKVVFKSVLVSSLILNITAFSYEAKTNKTNLYDNNKTKPHDNNITDTIKDNNETKIDSNASNPNNDTTLKSLIL